SSLNSPPARPASASKTSTATASTSTGSPSNPSHSPELTGEPKQDALLTAMQAGGKVAGASCSGLGFGANRLKRHEAFVPEALPNPSLGQSPQDWRGYPFFAL